MGFVVDVIGELYGRPTSRWQPGLHILEWYREFEPLRISIFTGPSRSVVPAALVPVYGEALAGSIFRDALNIASTGPELYGLYRLEELQRQPEAMRAKTLAPGAEFFMDSSNVWFYGVRGGRLVAYDAELDEVDDLGDFHKAFATVVQEWHAAIRDEASL